VKLDWAEEVKRDLKGLLQGETSMDDSHSVINEEVSVRPREAWGHQMPAILVDAKAD